MPVPSITGFWLLQISLIIHFLFFMFLSYLILLIHLQSCVSFREIFRGKSEYHCIIVILGKVYPCPDDEHVRLKWQWDPRNGFNLPTPCQPARHRSTHPVHVAQKYHDYHRCIESVDWNKQPSVVLQQKGKLTCFIKIVS